MEIRTAEEHKDDSLPKAILAALSSLDGKREHIISMADQVRLCEEAHQVHPELVDSISVGHDTGSLQGVLLTSHILHYKDMVPILKWFANRDWHQWKDPADYAEIGRRTFYLKHKSEATPPVYGDAKQQIVIMAFFKNEPEACKWIKTGTKEVDTFKVVCPGDENPEE